MNSRQVFGQLQEIFAAVRIRLAKSRIMLAIGQNTAKFGATQALRFIRALILARLLMPGDFGVFALGMSVAASLQVLSSFGFYTYFLASAPTDRVLQQRWLNTIWTLELLRGALIAVGLFFSAGVFGDFFGNAELKVVLQVLALSPLIAGISNTGMLEFEKSINFGPVVKREILSNLFGVGVTVGLAFFFRKAVVLAIGLAAESFISVLLSYYYSKFRPSMQLDRDVARRSFSFGKHLVVVGVLTYVTTQADNLVIGHFLGPSQLGYYVMAYSLAMMPVTVIGQVVTRVLLPYYSEEWTVGAKLSALQRWKLSTRLVSWVTVAIAAILFCNANWLISVLYGLQWLPATKPFAILTLGGAVRGFTHTMSPMLIASHRPDVDAKCKLAEVFLFVLALFLLVPRLGTVGAASACAASYTLAWLSRLSFLLRKHKITWRPFLQLYARVTFVFFTVALVHLVLRAVGLPAWALAVVSVVAFFGLANVFDQVLRGRLCEWGRTFIQASRPGTI